MKKQILLAIMALFLVVLACNAVSAAPVNNSTTQLAVNNSTASSGHSAPATQKSVVKAVSASAANGDVYVSKTGDDKTGDGSKAHPYATISKALEMVSSGGNIYILKGTYNEAGLTVDKNVNILGESQVNTIIDAQGQGNIFTINQGVNVLIQNLTLTHGSIQGSGGAIYNRGNLTLKDCIFKENSIFGNGGAIYNVGTLTLSSATFNGNIADKGGAVYNTGTLKVSSSTFTDNSALGFEGGAVYNEGNLTLTNSTFAANDAESGSAVLNVGTMAVSGCKFNDNTAGKAGAGAVNNSGTATLSGCTFTGNFAGNAGAVYNKGKLTLKNCTFTGNTAINYGGAIYNEGTMTVSGCTFTGNNATQSGLAGAIYNVGTMNVSSCTFVGNKAMTAGGAIVNDEGGNTTLKDCTFTNNTEIGAEGFGAGAVANIGTMTLSGCTFTGNSANQGGAILNGGPLTVNGCTFIGNTANYYGGAITNSDGDITAHFNRFVNNSAVAGSAIFNYETGEETTGSVDAKYNWWGSNKDPSSEFSGPVAYGPWLVLTINSSSDKTVPGGKVTVTADLQHDSNGVYHNPSEGHLMDGTAVIFSADNGSLNPIAAELVNGSAVTSFTAKTVGLANVSATFDNETVATKIAVNKSKTSLTVVNVTSVAGKVVSVTAVLKDENGNLLAGKTVAFAINGVTFTAVTNASGVAVFNYTPSKEGVYTVNANFEGDDNYLGSDVSGILTVTSSKPVKPDSGSGDDSSAAGGVNKAHAAGVISMQKTGLPLNYLLLAIFAVFSGLVMPRRKN